jgi:hypothetical protein
MWKLYVTPVSILKDGTLYSQNVFSITLRVNSDFSLIGVNRLVFVIDTRCFLCWRQGFYKYFLHEFHISIIPYAGSNQVPRDAENANKNISYKLYVT